VHATRRILPWFFAGLLALTGCSATQSPAATTTPAVSVAPAPSGAVLLTALGVTHGPVGFWLPAGLQPVEVVDQDNVVVLLFAPGRASEVVDHLVSHAASMGFIVGDHDETSVLLAAPGWDAAFTSSVAAAGLTLRRTKG